MLWVRQLSVVAALAVLGVEGLRFGTDPVTVESGILVRRKKRFDQLNGSNVAGPAMGFFQSSYKIRIGPFGIRTWGPKAKANCSITLMPPDGTLVL